MKPIDTPFDDLGWSCRPPVAKSPDGLFTIVAAHEAAMTADVPQHEHFDPKRLRAPSPWTVLAIHFPFDLSMLCGASPSLRDVLLIDKRPAGGEPLTWLEILWHVHIAVAMSSRSAGDQVFFEGLQKTGRRVNGVPVFDAFMGS